jgi:hypothetical protein
MTYSENISQIRWKIINNSGVQNYEFTVFFPFVVRIKDRLCGLVVKVPGYRFRGPGSIPDATRFF